MSVNKAILVGNVGKDPDVRHLESGVMRATFSLATTETYKNKTTGELVKQTEWHNIVTWRQLAELSDKYIKKGSQIYVEGKITNRQYDDKDGVKRYISEIVADNIRLLSKKDSGTQTESPADFTTQKTDVNEISEPPQSDDLPF